MNKECVNKHYLKKLLLPFSLLFLFTLIVTSLSRISLYFFNPSLFDISLIQFIQYYFYGLRFDTSCLAYANMLFVVFYFLPHPFRNNKIFRKFIFFFWLIPNILILAPNIGDAFYFPFVFRRSTFELLSLLFTMKSDMGDLWSNFILDFWPAFLIFILVIIIYIYVYKKIMKDVVICSNKLLSYIFGVVMLVFFTLLTILGARGGFQEKPISLVTASVYAPAQHTPLVLNSAFTIIRTYGKCGVDKKKFFSDSDEMLRYFNMCKQYNHSEMDKKNVVFIVLESFSNEHFNSLNNNQNIKEGVSFTPFLDSLIYEGYFCKYAFSNGKRSIEGIPAIVSSVPTLMNTPFILSPYINNVYESLPLILKHEGYNSMFFHGGKNGTMNFDSYAKSAGFDKYYGMNEYPESRDFDGSWGIWDEPYLQYVNQMLNQEDQPFFATIFTLSSHHPYQVPEQYQSILPEGPLPIHKAIAYTDMALRLFFDSAKKSSWYHNTLFIITSDHSSEPWLPYYKGPTGRYSIPLLFYDPGADLKGIHDKVCQQTDIMPSALDYLGYNKPFSAFGNSIFDSTYKGMNITFFSENYQLISDSTAIIFTDDKIDKIWNYITDPTGNDNLHGIYNKNNQIQYYKLLYQSYIQQYNNSLIENSMICK